MATGIRKMFNEVAPTYELLNHLFTAGLDVLWRRKAAEVAVDVGGQHWLDVCSGTGEMARYLSQKSPPKTRVVSVDLSLPMVRESAGKQGSQELSLSLADARILPFKDNSFDLITISFATRNLDLTRDRLVQTFSEFRRILRPGGVFLNLETSQPDVGLIRKLFHYYTVLTVPLFGGLISGSRNAYRYLSHTVRRFYDAKGLASILTDAGFGWVGVHRMMLGVVALHKAVK